MDFISIITDIQYNIEDFKVRVVNLEDENESLEEKNDALEEKLNNQEIIISKLQEKISDLEDEHNDLEDKVCDCPTYNDIRSLYPQKWEEECNNEDWEHPMSYDEFLKEENKNTEATRDTEMFGFLWGLKLFEKKIDKIEEIIKELKLFPYPE